MPSFNANLIDEVQRYIRNPLAYEATRTRDWLRVIEAESDPRTSPAEVVLLGRIRAELLQIPAQGPTPLGCSTF
jgi:hypothetical protein